MNDNITAAIAPLTDALNRAMAARDATAESVARVNIASAHLQLGSPQALREFEAALTSVRKAQNTRSEGLLSAAFAPFFVGIGDPGRALELAQRAEEICRRARLGQHVYALLQLARVLYTGFADPDQAGSAVDQAAAALAEGSITNTTDQQLVRDAAGQAALAAVQAKDVERAVVLMRIVDPGAVEKMERERPPPAASLDGDQHRQVALLLGEWRSRFLPGAATSKRVVVLHGKAKDMLRWDAPRAQRAIGASSTDLVVAYIEQLIEQPGDRLPAAVAIGTLTDDDLVFVIALATDAGFNKVVPARAAFGTAGQIAADPALAARCLRLWAALQQDPAEQIPAFTRADALLEHGADDALRAEVVVEIAVCQLNLRQAQPAFASSQRALELAQRVGDARLARMARGNIANALLQLQRVRDALRIFEQLERDQEAAGEKDMAEISRFNVEACRTHLLRNPGAQ